MKEGVTLRKVEARYMSCVLNISCSDTLKAV